MQVNTKNLGYIFTVATIVSYISLHFFELGICEKYGIPTEFISINLTRYGIYLPFFIAISFIILFLLDLPLTFASQFIPETSHKLLKILGVIIALGGFSFFVYFLIITFSPLLLPLKSEILYPSWICIVAGLTIIANHDRNDKSYDLIDPRVSILVNLSRKIDKKIGIAISYLGIITITFYFFGYNFSLPIKNKVENKNLFLIRIYDNYRIYGKLDSLNQFNGQIIIRNDLVNEKYLINKE